MIDHVLNGYGSPAYSVCDQLPWYSEASEVAYDPKEAGKLLDEAGWRMGPDGVREKDGVKASLNLLFSAGDSVRQALVKILRIRWRSWGSSAPPRAWAGIRL